MSFLIFKTMLVLILGTTPSGNPADCDFESANICNYIQDKTDIFDWSRNSRSTSSGGTGPTSDHTYGTVSGENKLRPEFFY